LHVDVHSGLFPEEEVKPKAPITKHGRAHSGRFVRCGRGDLTTRLSDRARTISARSIVDRNSQFIHGRSAQTDC
jgi:hypothetical protein